MDLYLPDSCFSIDWEILLKSIRHFSEAPGAEDC